MVVGLEATNEGLPSLLYADPMLPLMVTLAIFKAIVDRKSMVPKGKRQVAR